MFDKLRQSKVGVRQKMSFSWRKDSTSASMLTSLAATCSLRSSSLSSSVAFNSSLEQSLPAYVTTERTLTGSSRKRPDD